MTTTDPTAAQLLKAQTQLQTATTRDASIRVSIEEQQATFDRLDAQLRADPKLPQDVSIARANARRFVTTLTNDLQANRRARDTAQAEVNRLQVLSNKDEELAAARNRWSDASTIEIAAVKAAEGARDELARLDKLLAEAMARTEEAQRAQSSAILARLGFSKKPAGEVEAAESVLLGSAATVDALRTARPDLVAAVTQADAEVARCRAVTQQAENAILDIKQLIAEGAALLALEACRAATQAYHVATIAARGNFGERLALYTQEDQSIEQQKQADQLRYLASIGQ